MRIRGVARPSLKSRDSSLRTGGVALWNAARAGESHGAFFFGHLYCAPFWPFLGGFPMRVLAFKLILLALMAPPHAVLADGAAAARYYEDGLARFHQGDTAGAAIQLKNALQQDRGMLAAQLLLARLYFDDGDLGPAEIAFGDALKLGVDRSEVVIPMARIQIARGNAQAVVDQFSPDGLPASVKADLLALRGVAFAMLNRRTESGDSFEAARAIRPDALLPLMEEVPLLIGTGRLDEAEARARRATELQPGNPSTWDALARVAHARGDLATALAHYAHTVELNPGYVDARVTRAGLLLDLGRFDEARADVDYLGQAGVQDARATYLRALLAEQAGDAAAAREHLAEVTRLVDILGRDWIAGREVFLMLGALSHHAMGNMEKARGYLNMLATRFPNNQGARRLLAAILVDAGDYSQARGILDELVRRQPRDAASLSLLGRVSLAQGRATQAVDYFERANTVGGGGPGTQAALGFGQLAAGDAGKAIASLEKALDPKHLDPRLVSTLTTLYMRRGDSGKALALARRQLEATPQRADAHNLVGVLLGATGDLDGARASYRKALELDARMEAARFNLVRLDVAQGRFDDARKALATILEKDRNHEAALYELGLLELRAGRLAESLMALEKASAAHPGSLRIALALTDAQLAGGDPSKAVAVVRDALLRHPGNIDVVMAQARALLAAGDSKAAAGSLRDATRLAEFNTERLAGIARLQLAAGFLDEAAYSAHKALTGKPDDLMALALAAEIALAQKRPDLAKGFIDSLFALQPKSAEAFRLSAELALAAGDAAAAEARLAEAFDAAPSTALLVRRASIWVANGKPARAVDAAQAWLSQYPDDRDALNLLAGLFVQSEDWASARDIYLRLDEHGMGSGSELNNLANVLSRLNDASGALAVARRALALAPANPLVADTLGWLLVETGAYDEGLRHLRDARLRAPSNSEIRYHLAVALAKLGNRQEALAELRAALGDDESFSELERARALLKELEG